MLGCLLRGRSMSQRLSVLLLVFGLAWCLMLLHYTIAKPRHQSSTELRQQILELSQRYVKALSAENHELARPYNPSMAGYVMEEAGAAAVATGKTTYDHGYEGYSRYHEYDYRYRMIV